MGKVVSGFIDTVFAIAEFESAASEAPAADILMNLRRLYISAKIIKYSNKQDVVVGLIQGGELQAYTVPLPKETASPKQYS
jgi:hypothetical protein